MSRRIPRAGLVAVLAIAQAACTLSEPVAPATAVTAGAAPSASAPLSAVPAAVSAPVGLDVRAITDGHVSLRWRDPPGAAAPRRYEVFRGETRVAEVTVPEASETGLRPAHRYCYQVRAVDPAGNRSDPSGTACVRTPDLRPPSAPGTPAAGATGPGRATISWAPSDDDVGVAAYEVLRDGHTVARVPGDAREADAGAVAGRVHCWTVRALDAAGNPSPPAGPVCVSAGPAPATGPRTAAVR